MKKTIREWLKELPEDVRILAQIRYEQSLEKYPEPDIKITYSSAKSALKSAFVWSDTFECHDFWYDVWEKL